MPSGRRHYRLKYQEAIEAHEIALRRGGLPGFIDSGLVKSAIARPYNGYYRPIRKKAAALIQSMCINHGFADANKRTCVILLLLMLDRSGYELRPFNGEDLDEAIESMTVEVAKGANGKMNLSQIETWIANRLEKKPAK